jgi:hypothetical protein
MSVAEEGDVRFGEMFAEEEGGDVVGVVCSAERVGQCQPKQMAFLSHLTAGCEDLQKQRDHSLGRQRKPAHQDPLLHLIPESLAPRSFIPTLAIPLTPRPKPNPIEPPQIARRLRTRHHIVRAQRVRGQWRRYRVQRRAQIAQNAKSLREGGGWRGQVGVGFRRESFEGDADPEAVKSVLVERGEGRDGGRGDLGRNFADRGGMAGWVFWIGLGNHVCSSEERTTSA